MMRAVAVGLVATAMTTPAWAAEPPAEDWLPPTRPAGAAPVAPPRSTFDDVVDPMLVAGIGTGALGTAMLVVFGMAQSRLQQLDDDPDFVSYRAGVASGQDSCTSADRGIAIDGAASPRTVSNICDEAGSWEAVSFITLPTALALLGVASYLVIASDALKDNDAIALRVVPTVTPRTATLQVEASF
jgi:hypothetical protein